METGKHIAETLGIRADLEVTGQGLYFRWVSNNPEQEIVRYQVMNTTVAIAIGNQTEYRTIFFYPATQIDPDKTGFYQMRCEDRNSGEPYVLVPMIYKPTFDSLTPEQVNDLIAVKVMGCNGTTRQRNGFSKEYLREENANYVLWIEFDPYHSLDDCWKAEEKLNIATKEEVERLSSYGFQGHIGTTALYNTYVLILLEIMKMDPMVNFDIAVSIVHATPKQKCEAMLRAIGEVA